MDTILFIAFKNSRFLVSGGEIEIRKGEWEGRGGEERSRDVANKNLSGFIGGSLITIPQAPYPHHHPAAFRTPRLS